MESVHDSHRGRVYGIFITAGGFLGNIAPWVIGVWVEKLGVKSSEPRSYLPLYSALSLLMLGSLAGLPFLYGIRRCEHIIEPANSSSRRLLALP